MKYSSIPSAQSVVFHCKSRGIKNVVISPGSRNAPLVIGFTNDPYFSCYSIVDERCAAFFALGMAQHLKMPVIAVCTSGSALLNYYPAVAEAFYSDIPLVVISADRPAYKVDIGDGQTIRQESLFEKHIGYSANLKQDISHATETVKKFDPSLFPKDYTLEQLQSKIQGFNDAQLNNALQAAIIQKSPVQINIPFEEPLYDIEENPELSPFCSPLDLEKNNEDINFQDLAQIWNSCEKKMIIIGVNDPGRINSEYLKTLANDDSVLVFTEVTSNVNNKNFFPSIDSIIAPIEKSKDKDRLFRELQPELLITLGGLIVSKKIKAFLRQYKPKHHWHINNKKAFDTFFSLTKHIKTDENSFFEQFLEHIIELPSNYFSKWNEVKHEYLTKREIYLDQIPFTDFLAFQIICCGIPKNYQLQLANSSTVRYAQLFDIDPSLSVFCNRGTSGIDGSTSTAIGSSIHSVNPTLLISGDLSFFYDSNGLWNSYIRNDFRIIVINNGGGGIFRILPGMENSQNFETFFETVQDLDLQSLCSLYNIAHLVAEDQNTLNTILSTFYMPSKTPVLLEVKTPRLLNDKILLSYFDFIS
ncbi:2-succinyl-5-enolpyruvyl-6-hydroxy-3-cyclohexene-1-carboxylic-acid synthase [uncultured Eudoraea sp.]|uniref:2-succinyl-5-enolpyruvyl-6-hydroxy-3- cyclohexene-1-carboxylic-acid synthase n=1 Tax=uncultured Eudoraea sp. TaxID=1035614 RepID=UPI00262758A0|nr:2-succinyl-5-enolpyruvyl-6-hydroxy-3-cyclohexene-1-carboxylic-acid synthase [uncultured Eudoraea sp.]